MRTHVRTFHGLHLVTGLLSWQPRRQRVPKVIRKRFPLGDQVRLRTTTDPDLVAFRAVLFRVGGDLGDMLIDVHGWDARNPAGPGHLVKKYGASPVRIAQSVELAEGLLRSDPDLAPILHRIFARRERDTLKLASDLTRLITRRAPLAWRSALIDGYLSSLNGIERFALASLYGDPRSAVIDILERRIRASDA